MGLAADDKAEPEPDVADEHDEAYQKDQEDGLVVGGSAGLLNLDEGCVVHHSCVHTALIGAAARKRRA